MSMMHIEQRPEGWTVVNDAGELRLRTKEGEPMYFPEKSEVVRQCNANGMYQAGPGNPGGYPEGTLLEFSVGNFVTERPRG